MPRVSIIIVTWNGLHHLKRFLPSVIENSGVNAEIILADNASSDGTESWIQEYFPEVRHILFDSNYGYCGGNNRAAEHANGDILLFLNNDVEVTPGWLEPLIEEIDSDPLNAAVQPKLRSVDQPDHFEYAGAAGGFLDKFGYPFCRGRIFDTIEKDNYQYDKASDIGWASGAALAIRKNVFHKLGKFDERFEFHMEEIDLCWRIWSHGLKVRFRPDSLIYHLGGGSLQTGSPRKIYYNYRNSLFMLLKNTPRGKVFRRIFIRLCLDGVAGIRALFQGNWRETLAIIRAHFGFYLRIFSFFKTRRILLKARTVKDDPAIIKRYLIIWKYFVQGKKVWSDL